MGSLRRFEFPLEQFGGTNVGLVTAMTVSHPLRTPKDASNYVARLGQVGQRMAEAMADAKQLAAKDLIPPRFILDAPIRQMRLSSTAGRERIRSSSTLSERTASIAGFPPAERAALVAKAEQIVANEVYPAWRDAIALLESLRPAVERRRGSVAVRRRRRGIRGVPEASRRRSSRPRDSRIGLRRWRASRRRWTHPPQPRPH